MDKTEDEHISMIRSTIRRFIDKEFPRELARELDKTMKFPKEIFNRLCETGVAGLTTPVEDGGAGVDILAAIIVIEELAKRGTALAGPYIHCTFYGAMNIVENGSAEQKKEYLPKLSTGEILFAYGLSEPDTGGDLASVRVTGSLSENGESLFINGTKRWCTAARLSDYIYTLIRTGPVDQKYNNLSLVIIPVSSEGIEIIDIEHTGLRYAETTDVIFSNVEIPISSVVGGKEGLNKGWPMLVGRGLDVERLEITAVALGIACAAVEDAWDYAKEREQFGKKICGHQSIRHSLVDARTKLQACKHMLYHAAKLANTEKDFSVESSMAKLFIGDNAVDIVLTCQRIMGAYGYANEYDMERYVRDIVCMPIVGGSSNMQRNNIASRLGLPAR